MAKASKVREKYRPEKVLKNWRRIVRRLSKMNESELKAALDFEKTGEKRSDVILRIARRLNKLQGTRQLEEMISE